MTEKLRIPLVGEFVKGHGKLIEVQQSPPDERPVDYIFESCDCRIEAYANGCFVREFGSFHESFGEGTSFSNALAHCGQLQKRYGSAIELRIIKRTFTTRERPHHGQNCYQRDVVNFEPLKRGSRAGVPEETQEVVWSSKSP